MIYIVRNMKENTNTARCEGCYAECLRTTLQKGRGYCQWCRREDPGGAYFFSVLGIIFAVVAYFALPAIEQNGVEVHLPSYAKLLYAIGGKELFCGFVLSASVFLGIGGVLSKGRMEERKRRNLMGEKR